MHRAFSRIVFAQMKVIIHYLKRAVQNIIVVSIKKILSIEVGEVTLCTIIICVYLQSNEDKLVYL